ncbi:MAG: L-serine ammonia-lyase, iron-sulfur-dependent, subunit beta [Oscillospiraceae bacterium]|nr:L-serine ammonia-lyase, iron-sulfur-dependent, subunit beta [Oscillospiraceae bacterium]
MDVFDIMGPIMVGPSSSHTAGAVRIGRMARTLLGDEPVKAVLLLHGSFAETGVGHGTDKALIAGLLGMATDDLDIPNSFEIAEERGLKFSFDEVDLREAHPNSVKMEVTGASGRRMKMQASSIGGGRISVDKLDGVWVSFSGDYHTLIIQNMDNQSNLADVTTALSLARVNVANMSMHRSVKGGNVMMIVETDDPIPGYIVELLEKQPGILQVIHYRKEEE